MRRSVVWRSTLAVGLAFSLGAQLDRQPVAGAAGSAGAFTLPGKLKVSPLTSAQIQQYAASPTQRVIVVLRDQQQNLAPVGSQQQARAKIFSAEQAPIVGELQQLHAPNVKTFQLINAVSATVSPAEAARLAQNPLVQAVVPDQRIQLAPLATPKREAITPPAGGSIGGSTVGNQSLCNTLEPEALQLMNVADTIPFIPQAQQVVDGNGLKVTGQGVRVGIIGDSIDPTLLGLTRPDGTPVIFDYHDFTGDPPGLQNTALESLLDATMIAAQDMPSGKPLTFDISKYVIPGVTHLPSPCPIRVSGVAPGARLAVMKVFSDFGFAYTSSFVQAIQYAVTVDHVNVLNESFGSNYTPDNGTDPISLADQAAYQAGVTVVVAAGDDGPAHTITSPATDPFVISVGSTTAFRSYLQAGLGGVQLSNGSVQGDNLAAFSAAGPAQSGPRGIDVVAPGEYTWTLCPNAAIFTNCYGDNGTPSPVIPVGGTSESAPLTSGTAALVIQAYSSTHGGQLPSPDLVKQIIMSTATDLHLPTELQGAGLVNALAAVQQALSIHDANSPISPHAPLGSTLLLSNTSFGATANTNATVSFTFTVTNTGQIAQTVRPTITSESLTNPGTIGANSTLTLNPTTDPTFVDGAGVPRAYQQTTFTIPAGMAYLHTAISWDVTDQPSSSPVRLTLLDPSGRMVGFSNPFGNVTGAGSVDIHDPIPGVWRAEIWTAAQPNSFGLIGYNGPVSFSWMATPRITLPGSSVTPTNVSLAPEQTQQFVATFTMPASGGDLTAGIDFPGPYTYSEAGTIPVTLRSLVDLSSGSAQFSGTFIGGNGRGYQAPQLTYAFNVPAGQRDLDISLPVSDPSYTVEGVLVDPNGLPLDTQATDANGNLQLFWRTPQPGTWRLTLLLLGATTGGETSLPFTGTISLNGVQVSSTVGGLPATLTPGQTYNATVTITNTGIAEETFFLDPRLNATTTLALPELVGSGNFIGYGIPNQIGFAVPPEVTSISFGSQTAVPYVAEDQLGNGLLGGPVDWPDVLSPPATQYAPTLFRNTTTITATGELPTGIWYQYLSGYPKALVLSSNPLVLQWGFAQGEPFDTSVSSDTGDLWQDLMLGTNTFTGGIMLPPGASQTVNVTFTAPAKPAGTPIQGNLYVDTINNLAGFPFASTDSSDELVAIPYSYTVQ